MRATRGDGMRGKARRDATSSAPPAKARALASPPPPAPYTPGGGLSLDVPKRRERNAAETKRRILDSAEGEFAAKGFDGARLGNIARAADVQQALIHHYFADKGGLYRDVIGRALGGMSAESLGILAGLNARVGPFAPRKRLSERPRP